MPEILGIRTSKGFVAGSSVSDKLKPESFGTWSWLALFVSASPQRGKGACICRSAANFLSVHLLLRSEWPTVANLSTCTLGRERWYSLSNNEKKIVGWHVHIGEGPPSEAERKLLDADFLH